MGKNNDGCLLGTKILENKCDKKFVDWKKLNTRLEDSWKRYRFLAGLSCKMCKNRGLEKMENPRETDQFSWCLLNVG